jgi:hypothetical protein
MFAPPRLAQPLMQGVTGKAVSDKNIAFQNSQRPPSHPEIFSQVSRRERVQASGSISADSRDSR